MNIFKLSIQCDVYYKVARKPENLAVLKANIGKYIHFSNSDRFGISYHKDIHPGNPRAVYGFPLTEIKFKKIEENNPDAFYDYGYSKYIYIFDVNGNILNMDSVDLNDLGNKVRNFVRENLKKSSYHVSYNPTSHPYKNDGSQFLQWLGQISKDLFKNEHSGVNILLRGIGYDAIETRNHGFGDDIASEIAVLNPSSVNLIAKINNPMLTKEQIKEIDWYNSEEYANQQREKELQFEKERQERLAKHELFKKEKKIIDDMEEQLREDRKRLGLVPEYFEKSDLHLKLTKEFNEKWKNAFI